MDEQRVEWRVRPAEGDGRREAAHRLAAELRRIIERLVLVDAPQDQLEAAADAAHAFVERLETLRSRRWYEGFAEAANAGGPNFTEAAASGSPHAFFDHSPILGLANPLAPPIRLGIATDESGKRWVEGVGTFGAAYEGPPGSVHGGWVAAAFDEVLGFAQSLGGHPGMTGTLTVRYRKPTPLNAELRFRATLDRIEGRKIFCSGTCHTGDLLTAEAEAIFVTVDFSRFGGLPTG